MSIRQAQDKPEDNMENEKIEAGSMEQGVGGSQGSSNNHELRTMNKIALWLIGIIVLGGVGYGGYYIGQMQNANLKSQNDNAKIKNVTPTTPAVTPTPSSKNQEPRQSGGQASTKNEVDPTADWKTFKSNGGWQMDYPSGYKTGSCTYCADIYAPNIYVNFYREGANKDGFITVSHTLLKGGGYTSVEDILNSAKKFPIQSRISEESITISEYPGLKIHYKIDSDGSNNEGLKYILVKDLTNKYEIDFAPAGIKDENIKLNEYANYEIFNRMLNSFKVTK